MALPPQVFGQVPTVLDYRPVDPSLSANNTDLGAQAECVLGTGRNAVAGTTNFGFTDTTYSPLTAQLLRFTTGQAQGT
jgi:hypothetical protein